MTVANGVLDLRLGDIQNVDRIWPVQNTVLVTNLNADLLDGLHASAFAGANHSILSATHSDTAAAAVQRGDLMVGIGALATWTRYGLSVPAGPSLLNVFGVVNGENEPTWKAVFDATNPTTIAVGDVASPGTLTVAAHRDHQHASPATWTPSAHTQNASTILIPGGIGTPSYDDLQDYLNLTRSPGRFYGKGLISAHAPANGKFDVSEMEGIVFTGNTSGSPMVFFKKAAASSVTITDDNAVSWVYYDQATDSYLTTTDRSTIHDWDQFVVGRVWRSGNDVEVQSTGQVISNSYHLAHERLIYKYGNMDRVSGAVVSAHATPLRLSCSIGSWYSGESPYTTPAADTFKVWYKSGSSTWVESGPFTLFSEIFDGAAARVYEAYQNGDNLALLSGSKYGAYWLFTCPEGTLYVVLGTSDYANIGAAQAASVPASLPPYLVNWGRLIGKAIIQKTAAAFYSVESVFSVSFTQSAATDHASLANLNSTNYTHLTAANATDLTDGNETTLHKHTSSYINMLAASKILGRGSAGAGAVEELTINSTAGISAAYGAGTLNIGATTDTPRFAGQTLRSVFGSDLIMYWQSNDAANDDSMWKWNIGAVTGTITLSNYTGGSYLGHDWLKIQADGSTFIPHLTVATSLYLTGLTASRLMATSGASQATTVTDLSVFVLGTANQITSTNNGAGGATLSIPATFIAPGSIQATTTAQATRLGLGTGPDAAAIALMTSAHATEPVLWVNQGGAGDSYIRFDLATARSYAWGIDNSDSDKMVLSTGVGSAGAGAAVPGTNNLLTITTAGDGVATGTWQATRAGFGAAPHATNVLTVVGESTFSDTINCNADLIIKSSAANPLQVFDTTAYAADVGGSIMFAGKYESGGTHIELASIKGNKENGTDGDYASNLQFFTRIHGGPPISKLTIASTGAATFYSTVQSTSLSVGRALTAGHLLDVYSAADSAYTIFKSGGAGKYAESAWHNSDAKGWFGGVGGSGVGAPWTSTAYWLSDCTGGSRIGSYTAHQCVLVTNNTARLTIASTGEGTYASTWQATRMGLGIVPHGTVRLYTSGGVETEGNARYCAIIEDTTAFAAGVGGGLIFRGVYNSSGNVANAGGISTFKENATDGNYAFGTRVWARAHGASPATVASWSSAGNLTNTGYLDLSSNPYLYFGGANASNSWMVQKADATSFDISFYNMGGAYQPVLTLNDSGDTTAHGAFSATSYYVGLNAGIDATAILAKRTSGGSEGSLTIEKGIITGYTAPT